MFFMVLFNGLSIWATVFRTPKATPVGDSNFIYRMLYGLMILIMGTKSAAQPKSNYAKIEKCTCYIELT